MPHLALHHLDGTWLYDLPLDRQENVIGRDGWAHVRLPSDEVSHRHAVVGLTAQGRWILEDGGSLNGTRVGGKRLLGSVTLTEGTAFEIGPFRLIFAAGGGEHDTPTAAVSRDYTTTTGLHTDARSGRISRQTLRCELSLVEGKVAEGERRLWKITQPRTAIGSDPFTCTVRLGGTKIASEHCRIDRDDTQGTYRIVALPGAETHLGGKKITEAALSTGDRITVGEFTLEVTITKEEKALPLRESFGQLLGKSPAMQGIFGLLETLAPTDASVLILGENGTGKDLVARALHKFSPRNGKPLVVCDSTRLRAEHAVSELFGHEKGAFTGADRQRVGLFEAADGGTIFLDEIGELSPDIQSQLLTVLQNQQIRRLGSNKDIPVNVRILAATNRHLWSMVKSGTFRKDLYFRLNVVPVQMPLLRDRKEDIRPLVTHLLAKRSLGKPAMPITEAALLKLEGHDWPGNVRELANALEAAAIRALVGKRRRIEAEDVMFRKEEDGEEPEELVAARLAARTAAVARPGVGVGAKPGERRKMTLREIEREGIMGALEANGWNVSAAARELAVKRARLQRLKKAHGIEAAPEEK